jgi:hypothetical protein
MCIFKLNNLGKVTIIYVLYILGKTVNLVKRKIGKIGHHLRVYVAMRCNGIRIKYHMTRHYISNYDNAS